MSTKNNLSTNRNFRIGYKNIEGLHGANGCKIDECVDEMYNDIEILSETWGCLCKKEFLGYEIIAQADTQKRSGVTKGRRSAGILVMGKIYLKHFVKPIKVKKKLYLD